MNTAQAILANSTVVLCRDDFNSQLHPRMFDELCEQFGHDPKTTDALTLYTHKTEAA